MLVPFVKLVMCIYAR